MSAFTHHRRFHKGRHWNYFNQSEKSAHAIYTIEFMLRYSDRRQLQSTRVFFSTIYGCKKDTCFTQEVVILFLSSRSTFVSLSRSIRVRIVSTEQVRQLIAYALCSFSTEEFLWQSPHGITHRYRRRGHGSLLVARGHRYKNAHNFVISDQTCLKLFIRALDITIYLPQYVFTLGLLFL